jgi:hypothetical protein
MNDKMNIFDVKLNEDSCKGIVAVGYSNIFFSNGRIEHRQGLRILKRKSCLGCFVCGDTYNYISQEYDFGCDSWLTEQHIKDGKFYKIYLSGWEDDVELNIKEIKTTPSIGVKE